MPIFFTRYASAPHAESAGRLPHTMTARPEAHKATQRYAEALRRAESQRTTSVAVAAGTAVYVTLYTIQPAATHGVTGEVLVM